MQTITHRVRNFLMQHGAAIEPWAGLDATYSELYALLDRRRDDPALWEPLEQLLHEVLEHATDPQAERRLAAPAAELLSSWDAAELVASLREALSDTARSTATMVEDGPEYRGLTRRLSPSVLGAFLMLGLAAAACGDASTGGAAGGDTSTGGTGGSQATCLIDDAQVLAATIDDSALSNSSKDILCSCMNRLAEDWRDGLTTLFETGTPEQIATALEEMLECCHQALPNRTFAQSTLLQGTLCEPFYGTGGIYKGVSFPT